MKKERSGEEVKTVKTELLRDVILQRGEGRVSREGIFFLM